VPVDDDIPGVGGREDVCLRAATSTDGEEALVGSEVARVRFESLVSTCNSALALRVRAATGGDDTRVAAAWTVDDMVLVTGPEEAFEITGLASPV